jgi:hypothetical protein
MPKYDYIYAPARTVVEKYGTVIKTLYIPYGESGAYMTPITLKRASGISKLFILQKRPHNHSRTDIIYLGTVNESVLFKTLKSHGMPSPYPTPVRTPNTVHLHTLRNRDELVRTLVSFFVWEPDGLESYQTSIQNCSWNHSVSITQPAKPTQGTTRDNEIFLGYGDKTINHFIIMIQRILPFLNLIQAPPAPEPQMNNTEGVYISPAWAHAYEYYNRGPGNWG